jgi:putative flavoprotein involved in K+ transport
VLVVGSGASGCQISEELLRAGRQVFLSVSRHRRVPRRFLGQDVYWWFDRLGRFATMIDAFPGRQWPPSAVVTGVNGGYDIDVRRMAADGIRVVGRITGASLDRVAVARNTNDVLIEADESFAAFLASARDFAATEPDLAFSEEEPLEPEPADVSAAVAEVDSLSLRNQGINTIIWATGYDFDYGWLQLPILDGRGRPRQQRGVSPMPGLYFLGLHWMHTFKSGLLSGVGDDAEHLADQMDCPAGR